MKGGRGDVLWGRASEARITATQLWSWQSRYNVSIRIKKKKKKKPKKNLSLTKHNKLQKNDRGGLVLWHALPWEAWHPLSVLSCRAITLYKYNKDTLDVSPDFWGLLENYTLVLGLNRLFRIRNVRKLSRYAKYSTARRNRRGPEN